MKIKDGDVWICRGWKKFAHMNELEVGTLSRFELLPGPANTFNVTFQRGRRND